MLKKAISQNPYIDRYHASFSQVNLALAQSLAKKKTLTPEDKDNIPTLVRQSIDQAQIAVKLNRTSLTSWQTLSQTYVSLLNFVVGSDAWAESSLKQVIALDPMNPLHRLTLASFYEKQNKPTRADEQYKDALRITTTDPRTYYRYATFLINQKDYNHAFEYLTIALNLVAPGSENEKTITSTRKSIESMINSKNNINTINSSTLSNTVPNRELNDKSSTSSGIPQAIPTIKY
jgi:Tfp pilus assembly protein PilF